MQAFNALEEEIMMIIWRLKKAFPKEVMTYLKEPTPPYNTVLSTIRKLEKDGWLGYYVFGKSHQYYPKVDKDKYNKKSFSKFYRDFMDKDKLSLLSYFMEEEKIDINELEKIIQSIKKK